MSRVLRMFAKIVLQRNSFMFSEKNRLICCVINMLFRLLPRVLNKILKLLTSTKMLKPKNNSIKKSEHLIH